jgi:hypothetical protein
LRFDEAVCIGGSRSNGTIGSLDNHACVVTPSPTPDCVNGHYPLSGVDAVRSQVWLAVAVEVPNCQGEKLVPSV